MKTTSRLSLLRFHQYCSCDVCIEKAAQLPVKKNRPRDGEIPQVGRGGRVEALDAGREASFL
jgi:hypothetical protein